MTERLEYRVRSGRIALSAALSGVAARPLGAMRASRTMSGYSSASARPKKAMPANAQRQPRCWAITPPRPMPSTEPNMPPAMNEPARVARISRGNTATTTAIPTLP
ncbi:hypothetical protein D3C81_1903500 [compost metagenome]